MTDLLESYVNGNIQHVCNALENAPFSFSEFYAAYVELYNPDQEALTLFVDRLTNCP